MEHDLYTDADKDKPDVICDWDGHVVLGLCKRCGKAEIELDEPCVARRVVLSSRNPVRYAPSDERKRR